MLNWRRVERLYVELPFARPGSAGAYLGAVLVPLAATALRLWLEPWLEGVQFITYFPALILVSLVCGFRAGLVAAILSVAASWFFVVFPRQSFAIVRIEDGIGLGLFALSALMIVAIVGAMRLAVERYRLLARNLGRRIDERTAELERAQDALVQAQKMEALGQLTGGIAHDFNNMLTIVIGNLDLAKRRLAKGASAEKQIGHALDGAERAAALTERLLVFARRQPLAPTVCDVNRLLGNLSELLRRTLGKTMRIEARAAPGLWQVSVDAAQLESAIVNLAINARDAMDGAGTVRIETANLSVGGDGSGVAPGDYVCLSVSDDGAGMPPEIATRAAEPFFTTKAPGRGTGLGLSQVYGFVGQCGGHLDIRSAEGAGTTVTLYFPRYDGVGDPGAMPDSSELPRGRPGEVVLVVEDEDKVRGTTAAAVRELGYEVREASGGKEALALLEQDPSVRLMFTDIVMPGLDGRALAERALEQRPGLKILLTSGHAPGAGEEKELLRKPFTIERLARALRTTLES